LAGGLAFAAGFGFQTVKMRLVQLIDCVFPYRYWRTVHIGSIEILIPPGWGDLELDVDGGYILHNRPRRLRIDGDAVWYASAIELRISERAPVSAVGRSAMTETTRTIILRRGLIFLTLAIANGVRGRQRREAFRVLEGVRVGVDNKPTEPVLPECEHPMNDIPELHPKISGPFRRTGAA
jgi:hypothetical protein